jgi:hypothetical protein
MCASLQLSGAVELELGFLVCAVSRASTPSPGCLLLCRMFALLDLAFMSSRACPGGGYTSVGGRYSKRHLLLIQTLIDRDAGDPIFYCTAPFEMMHKLKAHPAYTLSLKHSKTVGADMLKKVRIVQDA